MLRRGDEMKQLTIREARQALSRLDQILDIEGEVTITKRGKAVARLVQLGRRSSYRRIVICARR